MNQRQATVTTIIKVLEERGVNYELGGSTPVSEVLNDEDRAKVRKSLISGFKHQKIDMAEESKAKYLNDEKALASYVSGLVNNWIRKAPEFNAGGKYQAKNPGVRKTSGDEQIAEMQKLLKITTDERAKRLIQDQIDARKAEIFYSSQPQVDVSKLPASLHHLVK